MEPHPRTLVPVSLGVIRDFAPVAGGLSGAAVYSVTTSSGDFILRVQHGDREAWGRAVAMQRLAAAHGIAPELVAVDEDHAASVSVKVTGIPFHAAAAQPAVRPAAFSSLTQTLSKLHAVPLTMSADPAADRDRLARTIWTSQVRRPGFPPWALPLEARLHEALGALAADPRQVFSHCDLHPANVLWDGSRVWLLDWERATLAHPYLDLATFSNFMNLPDEAAVALLGAQEKAPLDADAQSTFRWLRDFSRIVYGAVFLGLVPDLTDVDITDRDATPSLGACFAQSAAGTLSPGTPRGQALIGAALLKLRD